MSFQDAAVAARVLRPKRDQLEFLSAAKTFQLEVSGADHLVTWFTTTMTKMLSAGNEYGVKMKDGTVRYTNNSNGGPVFVYVKDGKIVRVTPVEFDESDAKAWTIKARGKEFTPPHKTTVSPHTLAWKSLIYSPDRLLYPMKRVDFDPNGERNPQNRGISGYERISWDEALDLVADEIKRVKRDHGPGAIMNGSGSHQNWGAIGYWLSARIRFFNSIGWTPIAHNPDSWEGWYWGAVHHWGQSTRLGGGETFSTVEDLLKNAEMIVFWSSDPESTSGVYGAQEGTVRRRWLKELGIPMVHIDPYFNHTAGWLGGKWLAPKPGTDSAMVLAIAYVWITENLYDKKYVFERTTRLRQVEGLRPGRGGRHRQDARVAGGRDRRARPRTCARWPGSGAARRPTWLPAATSASAAPAGPLPAPTGPGAWCISWPCRAWASRASTWAACSRAPRSTPASTSRATPRAACPATSTPPGFRCTCTSACRSS